MPMSFVTLRPGVNTVATQTLNMAGISISNLIRFRNGLVEKLGGWSQLVASTMASTTRCLHAWQNLNSLSWLAVGGSGLQAIQGTSVSTITPQSLTTNPALNVTTAAGSKTITIIDTSVSSMSQYSAVFFNTPISVGGIVLTGMYMINSGGSGTSYSITAPNPATSAVFNGGAVPSFSVQSGSAGVTVTFANHGLTTSDSFAFPIATVVGGITISGTYPIASVVNASTFTITASAPATSTASGSMNSGNAQYLYYIGAVNAGTNTSLALGPIGQFAIGEGYSSTFAPAYQTGTAITATDWTLTNWGEILLACPKGGPIFYWLTNSGFTSAVPIGQGPALNNGIFVAMPQQILVSWGSTQSLFSGKTNDAIDPLIVRWSDVQNFFSWQATSVNQAGSFHIPTGSKIVGGIQGANQALIFTDIGVWSMQYVGPPSVFGFVEIGRGCGLIATHAVCSLAGTTYYMGTNNFYVVGGGGVRPIPCEVWDNVFQDLDTANQSKCVAGANSLFNEITFFYPSLSGGTGECDKYVKYNVTEGVWDYGTLARSAWIDQSVVGNPIGADPNTKLLQQHEVGYNDNGSAMDSFFETGYFDFGDGENFIFSDLLIPDMKWKTQSGATSASLQMTCSAQDFPNNTPIPSTTFTFTNTSLYATPRIRGRQIKLRVESQDTGSWWRIGKIRYRYGIDGRR